jgi:hypothetical protein
LTKLVPSARLIQTKLQSLFADAVMIAIRAENTAVAWLGPQSGATPGTGVKNQSVIERNIEFLDKATFWAGQVRSDY